MRVLDAAVVNGTARGHNGEVAVPTPEPWQRASEIIIRSLHARLGTALDPTVIKAEVDAEFAAFSKARVRDFVPILVEARVRSRHSRSAAAP